MKQTVEEVAWEAAEDCYECHYDDSLEMRLVKEAFRQGAEWQSKQSPWISVKERLPEENENIIIMCEHGAIFNGTYCNGVWFCMDPLKKYGSVDCGTNEELFLAIAALRDDSNYMQWFITDSILSVSYDDSIGNDHYFTELKGIMFFWDENWDNATIISGRYHKATVDELIEYFKTKEEQ